MQNIDWSSPPVAAETWRKFWNENLVVKISDNTGRKGDKQQLFQADLLQPESKLWTQVVKMENKPNQNHQQR